MTLYPRSEPAPDIRIRIPAIVIRIPCPGTAIRVIAPIAACDKPAIHDDHCPIRKICVRAAFFRFLRILISLCSAQRTGTR